MYAKVADKKAEIRSDISNGVSEEKNAKDFFSLLIRANEDEGEKLKLTDSEVVRNELLFFAPILLELSLRLEMYTLCFLLVMVRHFNYANSMWSDHRAFLETTAQSIAATLTLLALNPEIQEEIMEETHDIIGDDQNPVGTKFHVATGMTPMTLKFLEGLPQICSFGKAHCSLL